MTSIELPAAWAEMVKKDEPPKAKPTPPARSSVGLTDAQLAMRKTGIGGSEIGALLDESDFMTPFDVWLSKTQGWVTPVNEDMKRGTFLEDGIARWYCERFGIPPERSDSLGPTPSTTLRHRTRSVALCTPDRMIHGRDGALSRLLSIKAPRRKTAGWGDPGTDKVPAAYLLQLQWEHAICSSYGEISDEMHLAALLDGELEVFIIQADRELQRDLLNYAEQWWTRHVVGGEQPSMDGSERAKQWLKNRFPKDNGNARDATPREVRLMVELEFAEFELARADAAFDNLANQLRESMGETWRLDAPNGYVTWKTDRRGNKAFRTKFTNKEKS